MNDEESTDSRGTMANSKHLLEAEGAKSKRGRKPTHESRSVEIKQRIAEWKAVPCGQRTPLTDLAKELGISHQLASYFASRAPSPDPVAEAAARIRAKLPQIIEIVRTWEEIDRKVRVRRPLSRAELKFLRIAAQTGNREARAMLRRLDGDAKRQ